MQWFNKIAQQVPPNAWAGPEGSIAEEMTQALQDGGETYRKWNEIDNFARAAQQNGQPFPPHQQLTAFLDRIQGPQDPQWQTFKQNIDGAYTQMQMMEGMNNKSDWDDAPEPEPRQVQDDDGWGENMFAGQRWKHLKQAQALQTMKGLPNEGYCKNCKGYVAMQGKYCTMCGEPAQSVKELLAPPPAGKQPPTAKPPAAIEPGKAPSAFAKSDDHWMK